MYSAADQIVTSCFVWLHPIILYCIRSDTSVLVQSAASMCFAADQTDASNFFCQRSECRIFALCFRSNCRFPFVLLRSECSILAHCLESNCLFRFFYQRSQCSNYALYRGSNCRFRFFCLPPECSIYALCFGSDCRFPFVLPPIRVQYLFALPRITLSLPGISV